MNAHVMSLFSAACGATGPLVFGIQEEDGVEEVRLAFPPSFLVIGRDPDVDLTLDHEPVSPRHAYLQVIAGRAFCVDLESRTGTFRDGVRLRSGWIGRDQVLRIGPTRLRLLGGVGGGAEVPAEAPEPSSPLLVPSVGPHALPEVMLEIAPRGRPARPWPMRRVLVLIGRAPDCNVRLHHHDIARFHCALVRTPGGVWLVDLLADQDLSLNGMRERVARLDEGDELRLGPFSIRLRYETPPEPTVVAARAGTPALIPAPSRAAPIESLRSEVEALQAVQPLLDQVIQVQQQMFDQFQLSMLVLARMFGTMHREHMDAIRDGLDQIRTLTEGMSALRRDLEQALPAKSPAPRAESPAPPPIARTQAPTDGAADIPAASDRSPVEPRIWRDPMELHAIVQERLAAFEREREGHWSKLFKLVTGG